MKGVFALFFGTCALVAVFCSQPTLAGGFETLLFTQEGKLLFPKLGEEIPEGSLSLSPRVLKTCPATGNKKCVTWDLAVATGTPLATIQSLKDKINLALQLFSTNTGFDITFAFGATVHKVGIPYRFGVGSTEPQVDEFGNSIVDGNFLISFLPPPDWEFPAGTLSRSAKYTVPNLAEKSAEMKWAGVFFNPAYQPATDYRLDQAMAHEAARFIGLAPSGARSSKVFPVQTIQGSGAIQLSSDDRAWVSSLYPGVIAHVGRGSISGEVIDGDSGEKLLGVHVELIPLSRRDQFALGADRALAEVSGFTRDEGKFKIDQVPAGDYILIVEALDSIIKDGRKLWDDWLYHFSSEKEFVTEFYDGAGRESNREPAYGFSPQLVYAAATLTVAEGQETTNVQIITNTLDAEATLIEASGSSNERLSEVEPGTEIPSRLASLKEETPDASARARGVTGCSLQTSEKISSVFGFILSALIFALCLWAQASRAQRREAFHSEFQKSERYFQ